MAAYGPLARTRAELETLAKEVRELERKAGADGRAENAASKPSLLEKIRIREIYFATADADVRKNLIAMDRKLSGLISQVAHLEEAEANKTLRRTRASGDIWWILASVQGVLWVAAGAYAFGTSGAIGGAVVALFCGKHYEEKFKQALQRAIEEAQMRAKLAQVNSLAIQRELPNFSSEEEKTGAPDPETVIRQRDTPWAEGVVANLAEALGVPGAAAAAESGESPPVS